jgi:hypothetical protein
MMITFWRGDVRQILEKQRHLRRGSHYRIPLPPKFSDVLLDKLREDRYEGGERC